jgi:hypothetical protein
MYGSAPCASKSFNICERIDRPERIPYLADKAWCFLFLEGKRRTSLAGLPMRAALCRLVSPNLHGIKPRFWALFF